MLYLTGGTVERTVFRWSRRCIVWTVLGIALAGVLALAPAARAQQASGIAGVVHDVSGGVLPGVTVEAASPALIEKTRTVVTDGQGRYNIVDLRPGTYTVTFTLEGFSSVTQPGLVLTAGFTANISPVLKVGNVSENITVAAQAPVVDTQNMRQQKTLNVNDIESLPVGNFGLQTLATMTAGFGATVADVGGTKDTWSAQGSYTFYHGKIGTRASFDGFRAQYLIGAANGQGYITNTDTIQETQLELTGMGAESGSGSTTVNAIPKDGGNLFVGNVNGKFSNSGMQGTNLGSLASYGLTPGQVQRIYRASGSLGGPIKVDTLWFFGAVGRWGTRTSQPGAFFNPLQGQSGVPGTPTLFYPGQPGSPYANTPHGPTPADNFDWNRSHSIRLTWQANPKNRFAFYGDLQKNCRCTSGFTGANAIESQSGWDWWPSGLVEGTWTAPLTNRLLLEAGAEWHVANWINYTQPDVSRDDRSILEQATNYRYGAPNTYTAPIARTGEGAQRLTLSYVTGTHNIKVGITDDEAFNDQSTSRNSPDGLNYDFLNGKPVALEYYAQPWFRQSRISPEIGVFGQDAWTIKRLTLNLGLRLDHEVGGFPAEDVPAGLYVPARHVDALSGVPDWTDINPRVGAVYDIFGNGRTALKVSMGRYNDLSRGDLTERFNPLTSSINSAKRNWNDANGNYIPDCDLANLSANGECGAISNVFFGKYVTSAVTFSDSVTKKNRPYLWDFETELQTQLTQGLSAGVGFNRNWDGSFEAIDNQAVTPSDYDPFCVTVPADSRLPGGGGNQLCGFYDVTPALYGKGTYLDTNSRTYGKRQRYWNGFTFSLDGRLPLHSTVGGSFDIGEQVVNQCFTVDAPNDGGLLSSSGGVGNPYGNPFCNQVTPWSHLADFRIHGTLPLPHGLSVSAIYRNQPGATIAPTYTFSRSQVTFTDGRTAPLNASTATLPIANPTQLIAPRFTELDLSFAKTFQAGWSKVRAGLDLFNALNSNSVETLNSTFGPAFEKPQVILDARLLQFNLSLTF